MIPVEQARLRILDSFTPTPVEWVSLDRAHGRILASALHARHDQPPWDCSAMDGYAVRSVDIGTIPCQLTVTAHLPAGVCAGATIGPGETARIFTGAPLPMGADAIIIQEHVQAARDGEVGERVTITALARKGRYIRSRGLDFAAGEAGLTEGQWLGPREIGLAAAMNHPWLPVRRRPRVAILATGDEIVFPGDPAHDGQIISSNAHALAAFVRGASGEPTLLGIVPDHWDALRQRAAFFPHFDLVVTTGGASVGTYDLLAAAMQGEGAELAFWRIAMRPGKPLLFGSWGGTPLLGLPGNPVSTLVCALLFLGPVLARLAGYPKGETLPLRHAKLAIPLAENDEREDYLRARLIETGAIEPFPVQDSSMLKILTRSDGLIRRPSHDRARERGEMIEYVPLNEALRTW